MKIIDLLKKNAIELNASVASKNDAIDKLIALHEKAGNLLDVNEYKKAILAREAQGSTAIGEGIAVPHAKSESVKTPGLSAITVQNGVDYGAPDGKNSDILFMIAAPLDGDLHLEILSRLMVMLMEPEFCAALRSAKTADEFLSVIDKKETEKYPDEPKAEVAKKDGYRILAVTACPTGIAHTYMAAEALEKAGEKMGYPLKAETNGSGGAKNILTKKEIEECDGIIIAADKNVEMARFDVMSRMPTANRRVNVSEKTKMPIMTAVTGSRAPMMAEGVEPILLMEMFMKNSEITVGNRASWVAQPHCFGP